MKNLRLLLLGLLTPLFIGSCFAFDLTPDEVAYLDNNALNIGNFTNVSNYVLYDYGNSSPDVNLCVIFSGLTFANSSRPYFSIITTNDISFSEYYSTSYGSITPYFMFCAPLYNFRYFKIVQSNSVNGKTNFSVDKFWVLQAEKITNGYLGFDVQGLINDLNQCDTSVQQCLIDKESLSGSLATCNSDKNSLQNYNDALSSQLNECLNNQGTGGFGTGITLVNNSLFWYLDDNLLSLPITNNLFLPLGYQGALDSGNVLYISKLGEEEPTQYYFTEEDKISIIDILSYLFVFILGIGIIFSLIKLFKKIFTH